MSALIGKTGSGDSYPSMCPHEQQVHELQIKLASISKEKEELEKEKEEAYKRGQEEQTVKNNREVIESIIPRNLPQYRSDEAFEQEVEHRLGQINEFTSLDDLRQLYDAKLYKYAKTLASKTASRERSDFLNFIQNPMSNVIGNNLVHRSSRSNNNNMHTYEPPSSTTASTVGRTASSKGNNNSFWYLDLFSDK